MLGQGLPSRVGRTSPAPRLSCRDGVTISGKQMPSGDRFGPARHPVSRARSPRRERCQVVPKTDARSAVSRGAVPAQGHCSSADSAKQFAGRPQGCTDRSRASRGQSKQTGSAPTPALSARCQHVTSQPARAAKLKTGYRAA